MQNFALSTCTMRVPVKLGTLKVTVAYWKLEDLTQITLASCTMLEPSPATSGACQSLRRPSTFSNSFLDQF